MPIPDARGNMRAMISRLWSVDSQLGNPRGPDASWYAMYDRDLTFHGLQEAYNEMSPFWLTHFTDEVRQRWVDDYRLVSPHSPQALRMEMQLVAKPTAEQLTDWESRAGEDPKAYAHIAGRFSALKQYEDAIRNFERSVDLSPSKDAFVGLANTHRAAGQDELWLPTLERFFKVEALGLEHAQVHAIIANDFIDKGKWEEAEPHALEAGQTYSNWGLLLASRVEEALGHWDNSEKLIFAAAKSYPSSSGAEWYFWCRRTGRGHLDAARTLAKQRLDTPEVKADVVGLLQRFTFHITENDSRAAFEDLKGAVRIAEATNQPPPDVTRGKIQYAIVARELNESDGSKAALAEARQLIEQFRGQFPLLYKIDSTICDVLDGKPPEAEALAEVEKDIEQEPGEVRVNCLYFLGKAYDLAGNKDQAEKYWLDCVSRGPFDRYPATLAGKYLSDRHTTSRP
jgi:tetratricopeptide (TPR) repeat protein